MKKTRVMLIHTLPSPYRNPLLEKLGNDSELDIEVFFMAKGAKNRVWKINDLNYKHKFMPEHTINLKQGDDVIPIWNNPSIPLEIVKGGYDVVICTGWDSTTTLLARLTCALLDIPVIIWAGSTKNEKSWRRSLMNIPVKILVRSCAAMICYGKASREYLISMGVLTEKIFISYNAVDIHFFRKISKENKSKKMIIRKQMGITNKRLILFVGQLITRKGVNDLYEAIQAVRKKHDVGILWVGYGPLKESLEDKAKNDKFESQYFVTTHTAVETAKMYSIADFFVIPTHEDIYSNVVAEALASGLPVITTKENGASEDLLEDGVNGYVINAGDTKQLIDKVLLLLDNEKLCDKLANNTWDIIKNFTYDGNVRSFRNVIRFVLNSKSGI